jgi:hypothetical protein
VQPLKLNYKDENPVQAGNFKQNLKQPIANKR